MNKEYQHGARLLPVISFADTFFYIDVPLREFRQVLAPHNRISMDEIKIETDGFSSFAYDMQTKNIYKEIIDPDHIPGHVMLVLIPPLAELTVKQAVQQDKVKGLKRCRGLNK